MNGQCPPHHFVVKAGASIGKCIRPGCNAVKHYGVRVGRNLFNQPSYYDGETVPNQDSEGVAERCAVLPPPRTPRGRWCERATLIK